MRKFVLIGMSNPQGNEPLWPDPPGCAGHRLWKMATARTGVSQEDWLRMTDRRNLCTGEWDRDLARAQARRWQPDLFGRVVVLLGGDVAACFRATGLMYQWARPMGTPQRAAPPWVHIPHPSGLCREYNNDVVRLGVEVLLADLVEECRHGAG